MNNNTSNYDHNFYGSNNPQNNQSFIGYSQGIPYRYEFSGNSPSPKRQKKNGGNRFGLVILAVVLSVTLSFGAGFCGAYFANHLNKNEEETINKAPNNEDLYNEDPETVISKAESFTSPYGSAGENVFSVSQVVQKVQDSVVVIDATVVTGTSFWGDEQTSVSSGSGVIISKDGYILTCHHVVSNAKSVTVTLNSGSKYEASLVGSDPLSDLAVIRIQPKEDEPLVFAEQGCSADLVVGEQVVAIGNPLGTLGGTVTDGIVSATERNIVTGDGTRMTLLQTNAAINSGNSGGGLFNLDGKLIGIVNAKYASAGVEGLAFAIPIDSAYTVQLDLIEFGYVRGIVDHGLTTLDVTQANIYSYYRYGIEEIGVYVVSSENTDQLMNKDQILSVNGTKVSTTAELNQVIDQYKVGDTVSIVISRSGKEHTVELLLEEYIPDSIKNGLQ